MMRVLTSTLFIFFAFSELFPIPASNFITAISVNPVTGKLELSWTEATENNIEGYIIFRDTIEYPSTLIVKKIDSVGGRGTTMYAFENDYSKYFAYRVSPVDSNRNFATHCPPKRAFKTTSSFNFCSKTLSISWESPDIAIYALDHLKIFAAAPGYGYKQIDSLLPSATNLQFQSAFPDAEKVFVYVKAVAPNNLIFANSLIDTIFQGENPVPDELYLRNLSVTNNNNSIEVYYHVSNDAAFSHLLLKNGDNVLASLPFGNISASIPMLIHYADAEYYLAVSDSCGNIVKTSNSAKAIRLTSRKVQKEVNLTWSDYQGWDGGVEKYEIYRNDVKIADQTANSTNQYTDDLSGLSHTAEVIYYIKGYEKSGNKYGYQDTTFSNYTSLTVSEYVSVFFPTGFMPSSTIVENKYYKAIFASLQDDEIEWHIYNPVGQIVFSGNTADAAWDGNINSKPAPTGQYVYTFQLKRAGKISEYKGSFSLLR
ncbi:MAG: gliding motility-associated C-terminal domain-containing protein [Bacteroidales bacterium]|jgi:gliding motility-associated-like protein|nr:gliding motility-associated C-terminal domain-containing protein [Bacteroidales bacterium]